MFRNLFAVIATLTIGTSAASAAAPEAKGLSLEQRVQAAQTTIDKLISPEQAQKSGSKVAQYWSNYYRPWHNWNNWSNWSNYYRGGGY